MPGGDRMRVIGRTCAAVVVGVMALVGSLAAQRVHAQNMVSMFQDGVGTDQDLVSQADFQEMCEILELDETQNTAAKALFDGYTSERQAVAKAMRSDMKEASEEFQESKDTSMIKRFGEIASKATMKMNELGAQFMSNVRELLNEKQSGKWAEVERMRRRHTGMRSGMLKGETLDLVRVVRDLNIAKPYPQQLSDVLERYSIELDSAIKTRASKQTELSKSPDAQTDFTDPTKIDFQKLRTMMMDIRKCGLVVRDVNDRHAGFVRSTLAEDKQEAFTKAVQMAKFPEIYGEAHVVKCMNAAEKFEDLTKEQKQGIEEIRGAYVQNLASLNQAWATELAKAEADGGGAEELDMLPGADPKETDLKRARAARLKADKDALNKLKALLTDTQKDQLPERQGGFMFGHGQ